MCKNLFTSLLCLVPLFAGAQTFYPGNISGCIGRWDFVNNGSTITFLPDVSGNGNNSSNVNALTSAPGFRNAPDKAMAFNGTNSSATIPHAAMLEPSALTMLAVVKMNDFYNGQCQESQIVLKGYPYFNTGVYGLGFGDNIYDNSCSVYSPTRMQINAEFGPTTVSPTAGNYVTTNQWYLVAASYDGTSTIKYYQVLMDVNTYVNNVAPIYTLSSSMPIGTTNTQPLVIGRTFNPPFPYYFNGTMEEVVLFDRALTDNEVQSVYDYLWGIVAITSVSANSFCQGGNFTVDFTVNNTSFFQSNNTFTVQLSDAAGGFANPVNIGNINSTGGGTISCTIPSATPTGSGYRIRIVASNVPYTTKDNGLNLSIEPAGLNFDLGKDTFICRETAIALSGPGPLDGVTYLWNTGSTTQSITVSGPGKYWLQIINGSCTTSDTIEVTERQIPVVKLGPDTLMCIGETLVLPQLIIGGSDYQTLWSDGSASPKYNVTEKGTYAVKVYNICGSNTDTINVDYQPCYFIFPSGFSPNGDHMNDIAKLLGPVGGISDFILSIYNRWGNQVYTTKNAFEGWDGTYHGQVQDIGTYYYYINFTFLGKQYKLKGDITLLR